MMYVCRIFAVAFDFVTPSGFITLTFYPRFPGVGDPRVRTSSTYERGSAYIQLDQILFELDQYLFKDLFHENHRRIDWNVERDLQRAIDVEMDLDRREMEHDIRRIRFERPKPDICTRECPPERGTVTMPFRRCSPRFPPITCSESE